MATFSSASKSNRLLQSKRYTLADFDSQEAYTSVLDLNASEIFTQTEALPTSSLPYSGSSQDGNFITSGSGANEVNIARYYYQLELTPTEVVTSGKLLTWFAISGSTSDIGYDNAVSPQVIQPTQMSSWISNKYLAPEDAANKAETPGQTPGSGIPGYNVYIRKGEAGSAQKVDDNDIVFDYKTGILQWMNASNAPDSGNATDNKMYLSGYQYVGQTLNEYISSGGGGGNEGSGIFIQTGSFFATTNTLQITGSLSITPLTVNELTASYAVKAKNAGFANFAGKLSSNATGTGNLNLAGNLTASNMSASGHISASQFSGTPGTINELTSSYAISASYAVSGDITPGGNDTEIQFNSGGSILGGSPRLTFDSTEGKTTISGSLIVSGSDSNDIFLIKSGSIDIAKVDNNGNFILVERTGATPTAVGGGIMYSSSAFYVGID